MVSLLCIPIICLGIAGMYFGRAQLLLHKSMIKLESRIDGLDRESAGIDSRLCTLFEAIKILERRTQTQPAEEVE